MKSICIIAALAAAIVTSATSADAAGRGAICRQVKGTNSLTCSYRSMAACEHDAQAAGDSCIQNPHRSRVRH